MLTVCDERSKICFNEFAFRKQNPLPFKKLTGNRGRNEIKQVCQRKQLASASLIH